MLSCARIANPRLPLRQFITASHFFSSAKLAVLNQFDEECHDFLPWLERKAGVEISSKLYMGKSANGRSLFASQSIQTGDCILKVPYNVQIAPDIMLPKVKAMLDNEVGYVAQLAIVILIEQKRGQESEWAPYIRCLPQPGEMHSTIFWSKSELDMIHQSSLYQETIKQKAQIEEDFLTIKSALDRFPEILESITFKDFMHAYALVKSRAWESTKGVSLIPFADFSNHDVVSESVVLNDELKQVSEVVFIFSNPFTQVIAYRNYAPDEEVLIRYGNFSNATLLLDFGFTLPHNIHDQVQIQINIPDHDLLREMKLDILQKHHLPTIEDANGFESNVDSFMIKEVKSPGGKGKGLPQSLRAFARVLCCTSAQDLSDLAMEAAQNDGRLARRPLKCSSREIQAHEILLSRISQLIEEYNVSIKSLGPVTSASMCKRSAFRRQMALDLLNGELHVLESAFAWLNNYYATLLLHAISNGNANACGSIQERTSKKEHDVHICN